MIFCMLNYYYYEKVSCNIRNSGDGIASFRVLIQFIRQQW